MEIFANDNNMSHFVYMIYHVKTLRRFSQNNGSSINNPKMNI